MGNEHSASSLKLHDSPSSTTAAPSFSVAVPSSELTQEEESHHKIVKHRSLSLEKNQNSPRPKMNKYRASFRHGPNNLNTPSSNSSGSSLTVANGIDGNRTPRRARSFRPSFRSANSFRMPVCPITGLTPNQKSLIMLKWKDTDRQTLLEFGRNVFETMFKKDPKFLRVLDLHESDDDSKYDWRLTGTFKIHVQRFCNMLYDVIKNLDNPQNCLNNIREFGSGYATEPGYESNYPRPHVPSAFWDALIFSLNNAAKDMQVETSSRSSGSPTSQDKRFLLPTAYEDPATLLSTAIPNHSSSAPHIGQPRRILSQTNSGSGSVCPREAEAWNMLSTFVVGQMRFAYELERLIQSEIKKLGLNKNECGSTPPINHEQQQHSVQFSIA